MRQNTVFSTKNTKKFSHSPSQTPLLNGKGDTQLSASTPDAEILGTPLNIIGYARHTQYGALWLFSRPYHDRSLYWR